MRVTLRCSTSRIRLRMWCKIARLYTVFDLDDEPAAVKSYGQSSNEGVRLQARTKKLADGNYKKFPSVCNSYR